MCRSRRLSVERSDQRIDLFLIRSLAPGVDARTSGVPDPQHDLVRSRCIVDQHGGGIECVEVPALVERSIEQIDGGAGWTNLSVTRNDNAAALDGTAHGHAKLGMNHRGTVFEVTAGTHDR